MGLFIAFRQLERWFHQHIFKVGWLMTQNYHTTTILYYTFFLPGILLHELVSWLVAGVLNVRADRAIAWPEQQDIGELKLNFVRIAPRIPAWRRTLIVASPLLVGVAITFYVANNIFQLTSVVTTMSSGALSDVGDGIRQLLNTPDFWLWFYLLFTVTNTMFANITRELQNWRGIATFAGIITVLIGIVGLTNNAIAAVASPIAEIIFVLQEILLLLIAINLVMTLLLGTIETVIERTTGRSATFRRGKMITMTYAEVLAEKERNRNKAATRQVRPIRNPVADTGITSIYKLSFPVPGAPTREVTTQLNIPLSEAIVPKGIVIAQPLKPQTETLELTPPAPKQSTVTKQESVIVSTPSTDAPKPPFAASTTPALPVLQASESPESPPAESDDTQSTRIADRPTLPATPSPALSPRVSASSIQPEPPWSSETGGTPTESVVRSPLFSDTDPLLSTPSPVPTALSAPSRFTVQKAESPASLVEANPFGDFADPFAEEEPQEEFKPAAPRNPLYNRLAESPPAVQAKPALVAASSENADDWLSRWSDGQNDDEDTEEDEDQAEDEIRYEKEEDIYEDDVEPE